MGYQEECEAFALYGNQFEDDMHYEENARYDRWDGHRGDAMEDFAWENEVDAWEEADAHADMLATMIEENGFLDVRTVL